MSDQNHDEHTTPEVAEVVETATEETSVEQPVAGQESEEVPEEGTPEETA